MARSLMDRVADKVLRESLRVRPGENVSIETWNTGIDFAKRAALRARQLGAFSTVLLEDEDTYIAAIRSAPRKFLGKMGEHEWALLSRTNAYIFIPGPVLGGSPRISQNERAISTGYNTTWYTAAKKARLRGVRMTFGYVGKDLARALHKPVSRIVEHQLAASMVDFPRIRREGLALSRLLRPGSRVVVTSEGESLRFQLGKEEALDDGLVDRRDLSTGGNMTNIPPGYYAREIVSSTLDGTVHLHAPVPRIGGIGDIRFEFNHGRLSRLSSEENPRWLHGLVRAIPKDRRGFSAVAVGLNPGLRTGFGQDRLIQGAVTFYGMFQGTVRSANLEVDGRPVVSDSALAP